MYSDTVQNGIVFDVQVPDGSMYSDTVFNIQAHDNNMHSEEKSR